MRTNIFERLSFLSLFLVIVLLPLFFLPFTNIPIETSKGLLLVVGLAFCIIFWAIARFLDGRIIFPQSWLLVSGFGICLAFLLSALFSGNSQVSLFGTMFDVGSFWFIFSAFVLMLMSSIFFRTHERARIVLLGVIISSVLILIFQSVHLFFPTITSLGILTDKTSNVLGSWNALGLFAGFSGLMFLLVIEFFSISKIEKLILAVFILLSVFLAAVVNFPLVWILLGISSLVIFVYKVSITFQRNQDVKENEKRNFPFISFIVVIISLFFFMSSSFFGSVIPNLLNISNTEVNPSFGATGLITEEVLSKHPLLGVGPNRFGEAWAMYKPVSINTETFRGLQFWDFPFISGFGLLPTLVATSGGLGILAFLVFFILFLIIGTKSIFSSIKNRVNWEVAAFFVLSLYLFVSSFFYSTGAVIFLLSLAFAGVFIGLAASNLSKEISISFLNDHRKSFFSILILIFIVIASVIISFKYIERLISISYFTKALTAITIPVADIPVAEASIGKALTLFKNDLYLRTYAQIYLMKFNSLATKGAAVLSEEEKALLQLSLDQVVSSAELATTYDPTNYFNFQALGSVYQNLASFGVKNTYSKAIEAYKMASTLNPNNPSLKLAIASALFADGKVKDAKDYANQSLSLKPDYINALLILSQIAKSEGDNTLALTYGQKALSISPTNQDLIKYVDSLKNPISIPNPAPISLPNPTPKKR